MTKRFETLDALRGFAAVTVLLFHTTVLYGAPCTGGATCRIPFGYLAVDLFFALSGFVIAHSYDERIAAGLTAPAFMFARLRRLWPIYLVGLALGLLPASVSVLGGFGGGKRALGSAALNAFFLPSPDWFPSHVPFPIDAPPGRSFSSSGSPI